MTQPIHDALHRAVCGPACPKHTGGDCDTVRARRAEVEALVTGIYGCTLVRAYYAGSDAGDAAGRNLQGFVERLAQLARGDV